MRKANGTRLFGIVGMRRPNTGLDHSKDYEDGSAVGTERIPRAIAATMTISVIL